VTGPLFLVWKWQLSHVLPNEFTIPDLFIYIVNHSDICLISSLLCLPAIPSSGPPHRAQSKALHCACFIAQSIKKKKVRNKTLVINQKRRPGQSI
jgi:hypothetical protein